ncbi:MAG: hypothetical protein ACK57U_02415, partial [Planctomycetota bacterium]
MSIKVVQQIVNGPHLWQQLVAAAQPILDPISLRQFHQVCQTELRLKVTVELQEQAWPVHYLPALELYQLSPVHGNP